MTKKKPRHVTFTGVDERTDLDRLANISSQYPCEWGILYSRNRQGLDNRYPALTSPIFDHLSELKGVGCHFAAHICGKYSQLVMSGEYQISDRIGTPINFESYDRIQVNHVMPVHSMLVDFGDHHGKVVISQFRGAEFPDISVPNLLYDPSGGNGIIPESWPHNPHDNFVGYAGGLNAGNVSDINKIISGITVGEYWLDMETGVRTDDYLDLDKAEGVLREIFD